MENTNLSERELEIIRLVGQGKSNKEIAQILFISVNTVKVHLANIFKKIDVSSRTEATLYAIEYGLVDSPRPIIITNESRLGLDEKPKTKSWWESQTMIYIIGLLLALLIFFSFVQSDSDQIPVSVINELTENRFDFLGYSSQTRKDATIVATHDRLFIIGGETHGKISNLTEVVDLSTNLWSISEPKPTPVSCAKGAVLGGKIYIPGGITAANVVTNKMELFDLQTNKWHEGVRLPTSISNYALITYEGQLFLFGGTNGKVAQSKVITFSPNSAMWVELPSLAMSVVDPFIFVQGAEVFVIQKRADKEHAFFIQTNNLIRMQSDQSEWIIDEIHLDIPVNSQMVQVGEFFFLLSSNGIWKHDISQDETVLFAEFSEGQVINPQLLGSGNHLYIIDTKEDSQKTFINRFRILYTITIPLLSR